MVIIQHIIRQNPTSLFYTTIQNKKNLKRFKNLHLFSLLHSQSVAGTIGGDLTTQISRIHLMVSCSWAIFMGPLLQTFITCVVCVSGDKCVIDVCMCKGVLMCVV